MDAPEGSESQKENSGGNDAGSLLTLNRGNKLPPSYGSKKEVDSVITVDDPPLASLEDSSDEDDTLLDVSKNSKQNAHVFATSRMMQKYSQGGKIRKQIVMTTGEVLHLLHHSLRL